MRRPPRSPLFPYTTLFRSRNRARAPITSPMSSHAMMTVAVSVILRLIRLGSLCGLGRCPPPASPVHGRRSWRLLLLLVDVLDALGIGGAHPRGEIACRVDVIGGLGAAGCAGSGQAGLHAGVGRTPVDVVVRVVHFVRPGTRAPAGVA